MIIMIHEMELIWLMKARKRPEQLPGFASGFSIHQLDLPVPSFCTLMKRLCNDKLCRIEF